MRFLVLMDRGLGSTLELSAFSTMVTWRENNKVINNNKKQIEISMTIILDYTEHEEQVQLSSTVPVSNTMSC